MAIQQAYDTLGNPDSRAVYDQRLARAGVKVASAQATIVGGPGWLSTRNIMVAGLILIIISGSWVYHARQKAREQREIAERILRLAEDEKNRQAEIQAREEERRQAQFIAAQERQAKNDERQVRQENENFSRRVSSELSNAERQAENQRQREQAMNDQKARQEQNQRQGNERVAQQQQREQERAAQQRLAEEKRQLREACMARFKRPDC